MFNNIDENIIQYVNSNIFPIYTLNDSGHGAEHIEYVLKRCFKFAEQFNEIDFNILYVAAAFHDIAHHIDKKNHEKLSAQIFFSDENIKSFFDEDGVLIIKEAIEDHRASSDFEPRSVYGKILSSADRSTDVDDFLRRTHAYTMKHITQATCEDMIERAYNHTKDKYGSQGYAKSYVCDDSYNKFKSDIQYLIDNKAEFIFKYKNVNNI